MSGPARKPTVWQRLVAIYLTYHWWGVIAVTLATIGLAYVGIRIYCGASSEPICKPRPTWSDVVYLSLQLFTLESGSEFLGGAHYTLWVARFLAPLVVGYAAVCGLFILFADQFQPLRARFSWNHVVICGLGAYGAALAARCRQAGWRVVILESNPHNRWLRSARSHGAVLVGDGTNPVALLRAGLSRARHLIAVCGSDAVNAEIAAQAMTLKTKRKHVLTCYAHVGDPVLWERLRVRELVASHEALARLQFFNTFDVAARAVALSVLPPRGDRHDPDLTHLLLIGLGPTSERLIVHACRTWTLTARASNPHPCITVVDREATRKVEAIVRRYPQLGGVCSFVMCDLDIASPDFEGFGTIFTHGGPRVTAACVSGVDDATALAAGLAIFHQTRDETFPIVVCATEERGLELLLADMDIDSSHHRLTVLGLLERGCTPELVLNSTNEILARAIHDEYCHYHERAGHTPRTNPSMQPWEALPEALKDSNREQADFIVNNLAVEGCFIAPLRDGDPPVMQFRKTEIESMAKREHDRWVDERKRGAWTKDGKRKDLNQKTSPHLENWESLSPDVREIDQNTVEALPALLARVGLGVYRRQSTAPSETAPG